MLLSRISDCFRVEIYGFHGIEQTKFHGRIEGSRNALGQVKIPSILLGQVYFPNLPTG